MIETQIKNDIKQLIKDTLYYHEIENLSYQELINLGIVDWIDILISSMYSFKSKKRKKIIREELLIYCQNKNTFKSISIDISLNESDIKSQDLVIVEEPIKITLESKSPPPISNKNVIQEKDFENLPIEIITQKMTKISNIDLPEQRTPEWYLMRHNMITASDLYKVIGTPGGRRELLIKKSSPIDSQKQRSGGGDACKHGVKFEPVATRLYELRNKVKILEFGCIPHFDKNIPFGASPDGICSLENERFAGRMLEIKCPYSRQITGIVPEMYWKQVQGQLEVCDLEVCDFLECKITQYDSQEQFYEDGDEFSTEEGLEKGAIVVYSDLNNNNYYIYPEIGLSKSSLLSYIEQETEIILNDPDKNYVTTCWWRLELYSCVLIKRDREWFSSIIPKIHSFWEDVEKYRLQGNTSLIQQKKTRIKKKKKTIESIDMCLINSDDDT